MNKRELDVKLAAEVSAILEALKKLQSDLDDIKAKLQQTGGKK